MQAPSSEGASAPTRALGVAAQGPDAPAFRLRVRQLAQPLRGHGVELLPEPLFDREQARAFAESPATQRARVLLAARRGLRRRLHARPEGAVLVQRQVDLLPTLGLERLAASERRLVLDLDDAIWLDGPEGGGHPLARLKGSGRKLAWLARRAAVVLAGNDLLAEHLSGKTQQIVVVPTLVDVEASPVRQHEQSEIFTVGWIGSRTTAPYLERVAPLLSQAASRLDRPMRLMVCGGPAPTVPGVDVHEVPWSEDVERALLLEMDAGLMPLPDTAWTRGKCAYKALQYMAAGLPVVADAVGVSGRVIGGGAGYAAASDVEWVDALQSLAADAGRRERMGAVGRGRVAAEYSFARWVPTIAGALRG